MQPLDSQQVETLGRAALTAALVADGLEVARPERDSGIDLVAFTTRPWKVIPIQMKVATNAAFSVHRKYAHIDQLVMAYVWNARSAEHVEFYAMSWKAAVEIAEQLGWTTTESWTRERRGGPEKGGYGTNRPSARVRAAIEPHRMGPGTWRTTFFSTDKALGTPPAIISNGTSAEAREHLRFPARPKGEREQ
jgi:hypothetical protein